MHIAIGETMMGMSHRPPLAAWCSSISLTSITTDMPMCEITVMTRGCNDNTKAAPHPSNPAPPPTSHSSWLPNPNPQQKSSSAP